MDVDERSLKVLTDWNSREYKNEGQKAASLQLLIIDALKNQDMRTRGSCAAIIQECPGDMSTSSFKTNCIYKCINTKAI